jgi:hypothetical protein
MSFPTHDHVTAPLPTDSVRRTAERLLRTHPVRAPDKSRLITILSRLILFASTFAVSVLLDAKASRC